MISLPLPFRIFSRVTSLAPGGSDSRIDNSEESNVFNVHLNDELDYVTRACCESTSTPETKYQNIKVSDSEKKGAIKEKLTNIMRLINLIHIYTE